MVTRGIQGLFAAAETHFEHRRPPSELPGKGKAQERIDSKQGSPQLLSIHRPGGEWKKGEVIL